MRATHILGPMLLAFLAQLCPLRAAPTGPTIELLGLPKRTTSGQHLILELRIDGLPRTDADVEVVTILADRVVGRTIWRLRLDSAKGQKRVPIILPVTRSRVSLGLVAKLAADGSLVKATAESVILPEWTPKRLTGIFRNRRAAILDPDGLVRPALGEVPVDELRAGDPLGVQRFRGDLLICHLPEFAGLSRGIAAALGDQLRHGTSVVWLTSPDGKPPLLLHSGELMRVHWPFSLRLGRDLPDLLDEDLLRWGGGAAALPAPLGAVFPTSRLIVCSDRILHQIQHEPAAGWLWEALLFWALKPVADGFPAKRLAFDPSRSSSLPKESGKTLVALLGLAGADWRQPDARHVAWLEKVGHTVKQGGVLVVTGAGPNRVAALRALGLPSVEFVPVRGSPDLLLCPNLLLWGIGARHPYGGLLVPRGEMPLIESYVCSSGRNRIFAEFELGKGILLVCQADFDESTLGVDKALLAHLAAQLRARARFPSLTSGTGE